MANQTGQMKSNLAKRVNSTLPGETIPRPLDPCDQNQLTRSRLIINDPDVSFVTILKTALGGAKADVPLNFPKLCNSIMVVSCDQAHLTDTLFLHFKPLNKVYIGNGITEIGNEPWLPLTSTSSAAINKIGIGYRFKNPMPINSFLDIGQESGGTDYFITFAVGNNFDYWTR